MSETNWTDLPDKTKELYRNSTKESLKCRLSGHLTRLKSNGHFDSEISDMISTIKNKDTRLLAGKKTPSEMKTNAKIVPRTKVIMVKRKAVMMNPVDDDEPDDDEDTQVLFGHQLHCC